MCMCMMFDVQHLVFLHISSRRCVYSLLHGNAVYVCCNCYFAIQCRDFPGEYNLKQKIAFPANATMATITMKMCHFIDAVPSTVHTNTHAINFISFHFIIKNQTKQLRYNFNCICCMRVHVTITNNVISLVDSRVHQLREARKITEFL